MAAANVAASRVDQLLAELRLRTLHVTRAAEGCRVARSVAVAHRRLRCGTDSTKDARRIRGEIRAGRFQAQRVRARIWDGGKHFGNLVFAARLRAAIRGCRSSRSVERRSRARS